MRIAIDVSQMCYEGTGVARYVKELTQSLLELNTKHSFVLCAGTFRQKSYFTKLTRISPWDKAKWRIYPLPPKLASFVVNDFKIPFELLTGPVDLIHASDWSEPTSKSPIVTTVHDLVFNKYPETVDGHILTTQKKRLAKIKGDKSHIIVDSLSTKNDLITDFDIPSSRLTVVYPGLSTMYKSQKITEIERVKKKYTLPDQYILSVGTQEPRKNISRLQDSVKGLNLPLVIIGRHGWGKNTQTLGFVPDEDLPGIYAGSTVFAYPSLYEGFGFPILEAMACGTPVVTSNISSMPELAGEAAIQVDPLSTSAIHDGLLKAIKQRESLIPKGYAQARKFNWQKTAKEVMEVYEKITNRD